MGLHCCHCSWQSTIGPHGLSLWPGAANMILHHSSLVTCLWKTEPLDGTVTLLASSSLASALVALLVNWCCVTVYTEYAVVQILWRRASALFVHQVHYVVHRSLLPIAQSLMRLIVVRSATPSPTRSLSCHCCRSMALGLAKAIFAWQDLFVVTSCDQQAKTINCCMGQCGAVVPLQSTVLWQVGAS